VDSDPVREELNELRRGRGVEAADFHTRVGPLLRRACGIVSTDTPAQVRRLVVLQLTELCGRLPETLRLAASAALALHEEAAGDFLDQRIAWLANQYDRDPRTARRRVDAAFRRLAEFLSDAQEKDGSHNVYAPGGWYVESMKAVLRMDLDPPQLTEERRIVATTDELDEIVVSFSAPKVQPDNAEGAITAKMVYGGELVESHDTGSGHARFIVRLPEPLSLGQRHSYSMEFTSYSRSTMRPYYVLTPLRQCRHFAVRARFDHETRPALIWRLNGVLPRAVNDFTPNDDHLTIDRLGEVALEFHDLQQGLSYGLQWSP
jgi:hypothetical protein